jgi:hypothetical protein
MSIRLDPRRLGALKLLAAEAGVRPGELVTRWVEERLDAARPGGAAPASVAPDALAVVVARVDELYRRLDQMAAAPDAPAAEPEAAKEALEAEPAPKRGPGRPRTKPPRPKAAPRVPLHEEIAAVIAERGPQTAAELASAIAERGRYQAPRTAKPLDSATVNARVSNPIYRSRFVRREGRIGLAVE